MTSRRPPTRRGGMMARVAVVRMQTPGTIVISRRRFRYRFFPVDGAFSTRRRRSVRPAQVVTSAGVFHGAKTQNVGSRIPPRERGNDGFGFESSISRPIR